MIRVEIEGASAIAHGPFPAGWFAIISGLSGRKNWHSSKRVKFEASGSNIDRLKTSGIEIDFIDKSNRLNHIDELAEMATQFDTFSEAKKKPRDMFADYSTAKLKETKPTNAKLPAWFKPKTKPHWHQTQCLSLSWERESYAWFLEMGLGKTWICINNIGMLHQKKGLVGAVVMVPKGVDTQWIESELPAHWSLKKPPKVQSVKNAKMEKFDFEAGCNVLFVGTDAVRTEKANNFIRKFIKECNGNVLFAIDESHKIKSYASLRTKAAIQLGSLCKWRRILTGTPIGKSLMDGFSQFYFMDPDIFGHRYMSTFRSKFCVMGGYEMREIVGHKNVEEFSATISRHSYRMTKKEALDLPEKIYITRKYAMPDALLAKYNALKKNVLDDLSESVKVPLNAAAKVMALQQMVCGFHKDEDDETIAFDDSRLNELCDVIDQNSGPMIVWCRFRHDIAKITKRLASDYGKKSFVEYHGSVSTKDRAKAKRSFLNGDAQFFVGTGASGGAGLNLQGDCQTVIYYSQDFDALTRWQTEDRVHRIGMSGAVTYIDLVAMKSVDDHIRKNLLAKKGLADLTLDELRKVLAS